MSFGRSGKGWQDLSGSHWSLMRVSATVMIVALFSTLFLVFGPQAQAETVTELEVEWQSPVPVSVEAGETVNAVWHLNVNDDGAAPTNVDVPNVTVTFTASFGQFQVLPDLCLVDASLDPSSYVTEDGRTLVCNVGTQKQGSALQITTPIFVDGVNGNSLAATGTVDGANVTSLAPIPIVQGFGLDMVWGGGSSTYVPSAGNRTFFYNWTLFQDVGSLAGPNSATYTITVDSTVAGVWSATPVCQQFSVGAKPGFPWSGGTYPAEQMAPWVGSCSMSRTNYNSTTGVATYSMTITGINYTHTLNPTQSSTGAALPEDKIAVASGQIKVTQATTATAGSVALSVNAPTYTSANGAHTVVDDTSNNTAASSWSTGAWSNSWMPGYTGSSAGFWSNTYLVGVGQKVRMSTGLVFYNMAAVYNQKTAGICNILDSKYVTYVDSLATETFGGTSLETLTTPVTYWYYTGTGGGLLDPNSASYNPNAWTGCAGTTGWTTTLPADLSTVKAVKIEFPVNDAVRQTRVGFRTDSIIKSTTPVNQDIWEWSAYALSTTSTLGTWNYYNRSLNAADVPAQGTTTPGLRYPFTGAGRDVLRTVGSSPVVSKSADSYYALPGDTVTYTLDYSANTTATLPNRSGFTLVDTLPVGATYVPGSASIAPTVSVSGGQQVLTWTINNLPVNVTQTITYQAVIPTSAVSGNVFQNQVIATVDGTSKKASDFVVVPSDGLTRIAKVSDLAEIPNPGGSGSGNSSWNITITSADPKSQTFTDTIDVLPYNGDGRGTSMTGNFVLSGPPVVPSGATVYYTTNAPGTISLDPADLSNGAADNPTGNTVGWTTTYTANATAIRVIGGTLAPLGTLSISVPYTTSGMESDDLLVNTTWARASNTKLDMRTSASVTVARYWAMSLKKYVLSSVDADPNLEESWVDATFPAEYPRYQVGDAVKYRVCVTNTGTGALSDIAVSDDLQPVLGSFTVAALDPGAVHCADPYTVTYDASAPSIVVNTASATANSPDGELSSADPAGIYLVNHGVTVAKSSDPAKGSEVYPGGTLTYTVTFANVGSTESYIDYTDHLSEVLDDATLNLGSFSSSSSQIAGAYNTPTQSIRIGGYVGAGQTVTFTYSVIIKQIDDLGDGDLLNAVAPTGVTPPDSCAVGDQLCTQHAVVTPVLSLEKNIIGRYDESDQFSLVIQRSSAENPPVGSATTSGSTTGLQTETIAILPRAVPGATYFVSETEVGSTDFANYHVSVTCSTSGGTPVGTTPVSGQTNMWEFTYPSVPVGQSGAEDVSCVITNEPIWVVHVEKLATNCDVGVPSCPLLGAEFTLYDKDPLGAELPQTYPISVDSTDGSLFASDGLRSGDYWLVEKKAPAGFTLLATPIKFTLASSGIVIAEPSSSATVSSDDSFTIEILDSTDAPLPKAGGPGWWPFLGSGLALMLGAGLGIMARDYFPGRQQRGWRREAARR